MPGTFERHRNPYVGPRAFEHDEHGLFFGREREIEIMVGLVLARRASLLFSPSGAGKSSLLRAGLIPELTRQETVGREGWARTYQKMRVLPIASVSAGFVPGMEAAIGNVYVFGALLSLLPDAEPGELAGMSLVEGLAPFFAGPEQGPGPEQPDRLAALVAIPSTLLIFDQFEELFTRDPTRRPEREDFFEQVGLALEAYPDLHVLFALREDYLAELTPYAALLPDELRPRYRLELLGKEAACQAIQQPARQAGVEFADVAATKLVDDLRKMRVQHPDGTAVEQLGPWVEPVQLQVVCRRLWEMLPEGATEFIPDDVESVGDVDSALAAYYAERVGAVCADTGVAERAIRRWFDRHLITEQGMRGDVLQGPDQSAGLDNQAIWALVDAHLVRAEKRRGATWFELAHDRLVEPVRAENAAWRVAHLSPLQRQAALWQDEKRADAFLLDGGALEEAEAWAKAHQDQITEVEREFLDGCKKAQGLQSARRQRILLAGAAILLIGAAILLFAFARLVETAQDKSREARAAEGTSAAALETSEAAGTGISEYSASAWTQLGRNKQSQGTATADKATYEAYHRTAATALFGEAERNRALEATNQALVAQTTPTPALAEETPTPDLPATATAQMASTAAAEAALALTAMAELEQAQATEMAMVGATQTAVAQATQTAMAVTQYCYVGEVIRRDPVGKPLISIRGRVVDRNGGGVAGVLVRIANAYEWYVELRTDSQGGYTVDGLTQPIRWIVSLPEYGASESVWITDYGQRAIVRFEEKLCP